MFTDASPRALEQLAASTHQRSFASGASVFLEGSTGDELFVVVDGLVKLFSTSRDGDQLAYRTVGVGGTFGELSAIDGHPRSAAAEALRPTRLLAVPGTALRAALRTDHELAESVLLAVTGRLRATTRQQADLVFLDLAGRVARHLLDHADADGYVETEGTQADLADLLGASRQSVNQALRALEREGIVTRRGRRTVVARPEDLRARAGEPPR
jgi:CRP-like cAMP-binding protein